MAWEGDPPVLPGAAPADDVPPPAVGTNDGGDQGAAGEPQRPKGNALHGSTELPMPSRVNHGPGRFRCGIRRSQYLRAGREEAGGKPYPDQVTEGGSRTGGAREHARDRGRGGHRNRRNDCPPRAARTRRSGGRGRRWRPAPTRPRPGRVLGLPGPEPLDLARQSPGRTPGRHLWVQNSATGPDLGFYAARSYSLMRPPRTGRRWIRLRDRSATGRSGRGGRRWRLRWGRRPL